LPVPGEEEVELRLEGILPSVVIKPLEKRVVGYFLLDEAGTELLGQDLGEGGLPHADRAFDAGIPGCFLGGHVR
jgi:hypothetical protein